MIFRKRTKKIWIALAFILLSGFRSQAQPVPQPVVINSGVGGNNTKDLLGRIEKDCLAYQPDLTILMTGTNDMNSEKYIPLEQYKANLRKIIDLICSSKSKVLLMNILPFYEPYLLRRHPKEFYGKEGPAGRMERYNNAIKAIADEKHVDFLDIHHLFRQVGNIGLDHNSLIRNMKNSNTTDGVHPTQDGYQVIAVAVFEVILNKNLPHQKVLCFGDSITKGYGSTPSKSYPALLKELLSQ